MKIYLQLFTYSILSFLILTINSCSEPTPDPIVEEGELVSLTINHLFKNKPLELNKVYQGPQNRDLWITKKKYYLSNITAVNADGSNELIADVALFEVGLGDESVTISGKIPKGKYTAISFDLGVREDLNLKDPATFSVDHPLSVTNNMYWNWSTQYIFSKFEGYEILNDDTNSFVIHTGTQNLYRPNLTIQRVFTVSTGGTDVSIILDVFSILKHSEYTFDLSEDGQSHTVDNLDLAVNYMDNFTTAFK